MDHEDEEQLVTLAARSGLCAAPAFTTTTQLHVSAADVCRQLGMRRLSYLGGGSYGEVLEVELPDGRSMALKVQEDKKCRWCYLMREVDTMMRFAGHPHIVRILGAGVALNRGWILMEHGGTALNAFWKTADASPAARASNCLLALAHLSSGLAAMHGAGIAHRDVKPANILVEVGADGGLRFRLCDFGMSKAMGHGFHTGGVCTLAYRAPELLMGSSVYDVRCDVWSLGVTLVQFLQRSASSLFSGDNEDEVLGAIEEVFGAALVGARHLPGPPDSLRARLLGELPRDDRSYDPLVDALAGMLHTDPWCRTSAGHLVSQAGGMSVDAPAVGGCGAAGEWGAVRVPLLSSLRSVGAATYQHAVELMGYMCYAKACNRTTFVCAELLFRRHAAISGRAASDGNSAGTSRGTAVSSSTGWVRRKAVCATWLASCYYEMSPCKLKHFAQSASMASTSGLKKEAIEMWALLGKVITTGVKERAVHRRNLTWSTLLSRYSAMIDSDLSSDAGRSEGIGDRGDHASASSML